jgi:4-hydroxy-3-methylbut-2-enyl diphosphate reductase
MEVIRAELIGMCFGVRDALAALEGLANPGQVTIHGQLVHNEQVVSRLRLRGFPSTEEEERDHLPETSTVLITAHGISDRERARLTAAGKELIDTTCPLVRRVHLAAQKLQEDGYHVLVVGRPGHVEVRGIVGDLHSFEIVPDPAQVRRYHQHKLGIVCQSTTPPRLAAAVGAEVRRQNPQAEVRFVDTICQPTRDHQQALERLLPVVDVVVVVGGANSNNTRELASLARDRGVPAFHIQGAVDLRPEWFTGCRRVGLSAGTSTLDETITEVEKTLQRMGERMPAAAGEVSR